MVQKCSKVCMVEVFLHFSDLVACPLTSDVIGMSFDYAVALVNGVYNVTRVANNHTRFSVVDGMAKITDINSIELIKRTWLCIVMSFEALCHFIIPNSWRDCGVHDI